MRVIQSKTVYLLLHPSVYYSSTSCLFEEIALVDIKCCGFLCYVISNYAGLYVYVCIYIYMYIYIYIYIYIYYGLCVVCRITSPVT